MFSADLDEQEILDVKRSLNQTVPRCARALAKLLSAMKKLGSPDTSSEEPVEISDPSIELNLFPAQATTIQIEKSGVRTTREVPESLIELVEAALTEAETWLVQNKPAGFREDLLALYFHLHSFRRTAELYDEHFITIIESDPSPKVRLFCLDPSTLLRQALA